MTKKKTHNFRYCTMEGFKIFITNTQSLLHFLWYIRTGLEFLGSYLIQGDFFQVPDLNSPVSCIYCKFVHVPAIEWFKVAILGVYFPLVQCFFIWCSHNPKALACFVFFISVRGRNEWRDKGE